MMKKYGTETMAETMCRFLGVDPKGDKISSRKYFKGNKVSFDRSVVVKEVTRILEAHKGKLKGLTDDFIHTLVADPLVEKNFLRFQSGLPFHVQNRYWGGVLFGQLAPRFDNRIIGHCPISGKKLPSKASAEFLEFVLLTLKNELWQSAGSCGVAKGTVLLTLKNELWQS